MYSAMHYATELCNGTMQRNYAINLLEHYNCSILYNGSIKLCKYVHYYTGIQK